MQCLIWEVGFFFPFCLVQSTHQDSEPNHLCLSGDAKRAQTPVLQRPGAFVGANISD